MKSRKNKRKYESFIIYLFVIFFILIAGLSYITSFNPFELNDEWINFLEKISSDFLSPALLAFLFFFLSDYFNRN